MEELKNMIEAYSNESIREMENLHQAAEKLLENIRWAEMKINRRIESQQYWIQMFGKRNPKYDHEKEISEMAKKRLIRSYQSVLQEMINHSKSLES